MSPTRRVGIGLLLLLTISVVAAVAALPTFPQPPAYHRFADARALFDVPNFLNVASNAPFLVVAALGLGLLLRPGPGAFSARSERLPYAVFFLALAATSFGSAYYHLAPDNARLFWDRLPMSVGFAALVAAVLGERWDAKAGLRLLAPLVAAGAATVLWWRFSEAGGAENALPYFAFQAWAILAVVLLMLFFPPKYTRSAYLFSAVALYGAALTAELLDRHLFALGQIVSGHTLKHLLAALAVYQVVRMLRTRTGVCIPSAVESIHRPAP